jgi:hypothetical protein
VLAQAVAGGSMLAQSLPSATVVDLPVTNDLIRWWPNLFDVRDEITGQEGVVMGVLPPVETGAHDETEFGRHTGWVQLQPAVPNEVFTLAFWVRIRQVDWTTRLLGQQAPDAEWLFQSYLGPEYFISPHRYGESDRAEQVVLARDAWHHVAIARRPDGSSRIWVDGVLALEGRRSHPWPTRAGWLTVGSSVQGEEYAFQGAVRDLCAFDRVLDDGEVRALHATGVPQRPARNTRARLAATARSIGIEVSTNVVTAPERIWLHRRFTTEDGLPGNVVKAIQQTRDGYLWVGTEEGLARFDGRRFRTYSADNTAALKTLGQMVWSLSEDSDGIIWAGIFGGLLRIRGLEFTAFTNGLPQRFVLQAEPAGDGSVWVAGFNDFVPRGLLWLRRYHPDSGTSSAEPAYGRYAVGRELPQMFPLGLVEDRDGSIWLGSLAHGLVRVNQGRVQVYSEKDGLPGSHCVPVFGDDSGAVWITGRPGLTRYANGRFQTIRERDGLPKDLMLDDRG